MSRFDRHEKHESILFAVLGMSPSVLTETIWALASAPAPILPRRVFVLTTTAGRAALERDLFDSRDQTPCGWDRLVSALSRRKLDCTDRLKFGMAADHVRLFPDAGGHHNLADIATTDDSTVAADYILRELRAFTEDPSTAVLASIAGGRKTMGALLMSCMSLLGREQDRVLHVLVNPPFDTPLDPPFLFPERGVEHRSRDGGRHRSDGARIDLIDVPFVRMRGWYEGAFKSAPPGYAALVAGVQRRAPTAAVRPRLTLDRTQGTLSVEGAQTLRLSAPEIAVICLQFGGTWNHSEMAQRLLSFKQAKLSACASLWMHDFQASNRFYDDAGNLVEHCVAIETLRRLLSSTRKKLASLPALTPVVQELLPKREAATTYRGIRLVGPDPLADIRG